MRNTILAGNRDLVNPAHDCSTQAGSLNSEGYNLIGTTDSCTVNVATGDQQGTNATPIDPQLSLLANNGGPTLTNALASTSPALNAGYPGSGLGQPCQSTDQRGEPRVNCDIGAYERDETAPNTKIRKLKVKAHKASVRFTGSDPGPGGALSFRCKLDKKSYASCDSPKVYRNLKAGKHTLRVKATDATGNVDLTPAKRAFTV